MTFAARIADGLVVEVVDLPDGVAVSDAFHPDAGFVPAVADVALGMRYVADAFLPPAEPEPPSLQSQRQAKLDQVNGRVAAILAAGAPTAGGLHLALDDGSRADLNAMATTAIAAVSGALPWPPSYALGWITMENVRVPLPAPADGLALAAGAGGFYAQVVQNGRNLKDAILAAEDSAALAAIDIEAGWPGV